MKPDKHTLLIISGIVVGVAVFYFFDEALGGIIGAVLTGLGLGGKRKQIADTKSRTKESDERREAKKQQVGEEVKEIAEQHKQTQAVADKIEKDDSDNTTFTAH